MNKQDFINSLQELFDDAEKFLDDAKNNPENIVYPNGLKLTDIPDYSELLKSQVENCLDGHDAALESMNNYKTMDDTTFDNIVNNIQSLKLSYNNNPNDLEIINNIKDSYVETGKLFQLWQYVFFDTYELSPEQYMLMMDLKNI
jgi:hypothetical protein